MQGRIGGMKKMNTNEKGQTNMLNTTVEMFMSEYFLIEAILGKYLEDGKRLFTALGAICLIPEEDAENLYALAENEVARAVATENDFMRHRRMQKYSRLVGYGQQSNAEWEEVVRIKGNAILTAQNSNVKIDADATRNVVYSCLSTAAASGSVVAMRIMGVLQCEGIFLDENRKAGLKILSKAADWNDCISLLALLHYRKDGRAYNMARLSRVLEDTPFSKLYKVAEDKYGGDEDIEVNEVRLLYKAFNSGVLNREVYNPQYARILSSKALYIKDKEKCVFSQNKEQLSLVVDLPLKLSHEKITAVDAGAVRNVVINREEETAAVVRALENSDLRELPSYRPLCICADSKYILNMYARAITVKSKSVHTEIIDVGGLSEYDFEPSPNNIFVRSIDEDKDNRFLLFFCGEISERKMEAVKGILQSGIRAKFHLNSPCATLNLCTVLPVCFCDRQNADRLKPYCDVIKLKTVSPEELSAAVSDIIAAKEKTYGVGEIKLCGEAGALFDGYDVDTVEKIIDAAVRARREKGAAITLTGEILKGYAPEYGQKIGFGGFSNGRNR